MKIFETAFNGFIKVFSGKNIAIKHICFIALTAIVSYSSVQSDILKNQVQAASQIPDLKGLLLGFLAALIVGCYLFGYNILFMRNVYNDNPEGYLPEFDDNPFKAFFKGFPLLLTWIFYFIVIILFSTISFALSIKMPVIGILLGLIGFCAIIILSIFVQFLWIEFSKNLEAKGLYNIIRPLKYTKGTMGSLCLLGPLFIPIYILSLLPCIILVLALTIAGFGENATMYAGGILGGYIGFVIQLVWYYCLVNLYKEKFEIGVE